MMENRKNRKPFTVPVMTVTTDLNWDELHQFNDEFVSRYADILSAGNDMRNVFERELSCYETGIKFFEIGKIYTIDDRYSFFVTMQIEEHSLGVCVVDNKLNDECVEQCEILHDDESEFIFVHAGRQRIQVKPI